MKVKTICINFMPVISKASFYAVSFLNLIEKEDL